MNESANHRELFTTASEELRFGGEVKVQLLRLGEPEPLIEGSDPNVLACYWKNRVTKAPWFDGEREMAVVFCLNAKLYMTAFALVGLGTLNEVAIHPRDVFRPAIAAGAYGIVFAHNHPSGDPAPSIGDACLTGRMAQSSRILGIRLIDSIIVGAGKHFSFREWRADLETCTEDSLKAALQAWGRDCLAKRKRRPARK